MQTHLISVQNVLKSLFHILVIMLDQMHFVGRLEVTQLDKFLQLLLLAQFGLHCIEVKCLAKVMGRFKCSSIFSLAIKVLKICKVSFFSRVNVKIFLAIKFFFVICLLFHVRVLNLAWYGMFDLLSGDFFLGSRGLFIPKFLIT